MAKAEDTSAVIPRQMLQDVLAEHLTKQVFDNPEQRDELIRSLIRSVLDSKEYSSDKQTFIEKWVRYGIAESVKEIAQEWVGANRDVIEAQVAQAMEKGAVKVIVQELATTLADRLKRGY